MTLTYSMSKRGIFLREKLVVSRLTQRLILPRITLFPVLRKIEYKSQKYFILVDISQILIHSNSISILLMRIFYLTFVGPPGI